MAKEPSGALTRAEPYRIGPALTAEETACQIRSESLLFNSYSPTKHGKAFASLLSCTIASQTLSTVACGQKVRLKKILRCSIFSLRFPFRSLVTFASRRWSKSRRTQPIAKSRAAEPSGYKARGYEARGYKAKGCKARGYKLEARG